jgi:hypothetical protein
MITSSVSWGLSDSQAEGNLQREHVERLSTMGLGPRREPFSGGYRSIIFYGLESSAPPDARNLARLHLDEFGQKIDNLLSQKDLPIDDTTPAHLKEIRFRIERSSRPTSTPMSPEPS